MLHITNGDHAADGIRAAGIGGAVLPWRDVLHDGPVPAGASSSQLREVRARFIAECGWRTFDDALHDFNARDATLEQALGEDEVVLWFEHDLYDQLQLLQVLDWFAARGAGGARLTLICAAEYLGPASPARLGERFPERSAVTAAQLELAAAAWRAFRSPDPTGVEAIVHGGAPALPFVAPALLRHLEEFPSTVNGLSRTESQALESVRDGARTLADAFVDSHHKREDPVFLGDTSFALRLAALSDVREPLLVTTAGATLPSSGGRAVWETGIRLTETGLAVVAGRADHVALNGIDRWLGGVNLHGRVAAWRWDPAARAILQA